jgi:hypothetical protein
MHVNKLKILCTNVFLCSSLSIIPYSTYLLNFFPTFFAEPPKSFAIIQNNEAKESSADLTVVDGKLETIHCESRKSNPPPVLQWFLGDKQLRASVQVNIYESELEFCYLSQNRA